MKQLLQLHQLVCSSVSENHLKEAFDALAQLSGRCRNIDLRNQVDTHFNTYTNVLKYSFDYSHDPERPKILQHLRRNLMELADALREQIIVEENLRAYVPIKRGLSRMGELESPESEEMISYLLFEKELENILSFRQKPTGTAEDNTLIEYNNSLQKLFRIIWLSDKFHDPQVNLVQACMDNNNLAWNDKCLIISALTLSTIRYFDANKVKLLIRAYQQKEMNIYQRAFTGLWLCLSWHNQRLAYYPDLSEALGILADEPEFKKLTEITIVQFLRARDTEKITRHIQQDIIPEMLRMRSKIEERLKNDEPAVFGGEEDKNPDWEVMFEDSPDLYRKMEEFSNLQMEGADVFLSAFSMLKGFPFFNDLQNWFLPFHYQSDALTQLLREAPEGVRLSEFGRQLCEAVYICNSDKYSFCYNILQLPATQRNAMLEMLSGELQTMSELKHDQERLNDTARNKAVVSQYLQDLYRFYKLYPQRSDFDDIFNMQLDLSTNFFLNNFLNDKALIRNIGEFFFEKGHYQDALDIYLYLGKSEVNFELLEKTAYCYQQLQLFEQAIRYYHQAELFDTRKPWIYKKLGFCYRKLKNPGEALKYYQQASREEPENLFVQSAIGHALMELGQYDEALAMYFRVMYQDEKNISILRPLAWCAFLAGKFDVSLQTFDKIIALRPEKTDFVQYGHALWVAGKTKEAIQAYKTALQTAHFDAGWFRQAMVPEAGLLAEKGISTEDLLLMCDYILLFTAS